MSTLADQPRTACAVTPREVWAVLEAGRFPLEVENTLQYELWRVLTATWPPSLISREHRLGPADRPDFLIDGRIVLEAKGPRHRQPAVFRQLARYAAYPQVEFILLATGRAMIMPSVIGGKPVRVLNLGRAWL